MHIIEKTDPKALKYAGKIIKAGGVVSFATETVYGLACDATNYDAVEKIYNIKNRDYSKPLAIFFSDIFQANKYVEFSDIAHKISTKYLPGPLTMILPRKNKKNCKLARNVNLQNNYLAFRVSSDLFVKNLINESKLILAVTSANISGAKSAVHHSEVENIFLNSELDLLICGGFCNSKTPSTIIKVHGNNIEILRQGSLIVNTN